MLKCYFENVENPFSVRVISPDAWIFFPTERVLHFRSVLNAWRPQHTDVKHGLRSIALCLQKRNSETELQRGLYLYKSKSYIRRCLFKQASASSKLAHLRDFACYSEIIDDLLQNIYRLQII